jgi:hypothetical protein
MGPVGVFAHAFADLPAVFDGLAHRGPRVEDAAVGVRHRGAEGAEAGFNAGVRGLLDVTFARESGGVALHVVASESAQQFVDGHAQRFAFDVPQRHVERAQGVQFLAAGRIEVAAVHHLPEVVDARRVLADEHGAALLHGVFRAAFADAGDALVGLDGDDVLALVEEFLGVARIAVVAHARDLHLGGSGAQGAGGERGHGAGRQGAEEVSALHDLSTVIHARAGGARGCNGATIRGESFPRRSFLCLVRDA